MSIDLSKVEITFTCKKCGKKYTQTFQQLERTTTQKCPHCGDTIQLSPAQVREQRVKAEREVEKKVKEEIQRAFKGLKNFRIK
ncbi:hypothetical protein [Deinococcus cellulosilyticus]|uniref:Uncharacterized protein n=1 Tax=Deinococcus cellulosilyticus (strain DSM 18568 / NBRC 106333 / KACC 11606 / 5516J-15) TaxID=1223518 RepID=A0A511MZC5_DEIC1|nr:hypothetical protein [Deinococcus cellulosilyticus]GEM45899.1 hypothetical protein DC3_15340 [Deinococcus cellulosilyticus NBRC 106333 = KACC 11606]